MRLLGAATITRRRRAAGTRAATGYWTPGAATDTSIVASVQPATGEDLQVLPEGLRTARGIRVFTSSELRTADPTVGTTSDELVIAGLYGIDSGTYQVQLVKAFLHRGLQHHDAVATRHQEAA